MVWEFNGQVPGERDDSIISRFEEQVRRTPDAPAVFLLDAGSGSRVTYRGLNERANRFARLLRLKGVGRGVVVAISGESNLETVTGILAILKAGGAYLPLWPSLDTKEMTRRMSRAGATLFIANEKVFENHDFLQLRGLINNPSADDAVKLTQTPCRAQIEDFDELPIPDRSLVDYEKYGKQIGLAMVKHTITIQATRGCPYHCLYCHKIWPKRHVARSAENILAEVQLYYNMGVRRFVFVDDIFNLDINNSARFFRLVIKNELRVHFFFPNGLRSDLLTPEYIDLMVEAGTVSLGLALETASPRLQKVIKKNMDLEKFRETVEYFTRVHPHVILELFLMHGFPTETKEEALATLEFLKSIKWVDFPYYHILKIYPNSEMAEFALKNGVSFDAISRSAPLAFHQLPETLPFDADFTRQCQAQFLNDYFLSKERLLARLPYQMKVLTVDEIVRKYNSYLPAKIESLDDVLAFAGINGDRLSTRECVEESAMLPRQLNRSLRENFPVHKPAGDALRVLFLDLSQFFGDTDQMLYNGVEPPLGLMYLLTYMNRELGEAVNGRIAKSGVDFTSYGELKNLIDEFEPDVIGVRTLSYYAGFFHRTLAVIRGWGMDVPIIAGGPYATGDTATLLKDGNVDLAVLSEGEVTVVELMRAFIENNKSLPGEEVLKEIRGLAFISADTTSSGTPERDILLWEALAETAAHQSGENPGWEIKPADPAFFRFHEAGDSGETCSSVSSQDLCRLTGEALYCQGWQSSLSPAQKGHVPSAVYLSDVQPFRLFPLLVSGGALCIGERALKPARMLLMALYAEPESDAVDIRLIVERSSAVSAEGHVAPRDQVEEKLTALWAELLEMEKGAISIDDNFFELGGHSLRATLMMSRIHKVFDVKIKLTDIFRIPTVRDLSGFIRDAAEEEFVSMGSVGERDYYEVSSAQKRLFVLQQMEPQSTAYNMTSAVILDGRLSRQKLEDVFRRLIERQKSLRTSFHMEGGEPVQVLNENVNFEVDYRRAEAENRTEIENFVKPFDLSQAPLLRVGLMEREEERHLLVVDMHHIISDGVSLEIFVREFMALYQGHELPPLRVFYHDFAAWQNEWKESEEKQKQEAFWLKTLAGKLPMLDIPADFPRPAEKSYKGGVFQFELNGEESEQLRELALVESVTLFMLLLAMFDVFLAKIGGVEDIIVGTPTAGRSHSDLEQVIGMFVNTLPLRNYPVGDKTFREFLQEVKTGTLAAFNNQDYQFDDLVEKVDAYRGSERNPLFDVMFALQNRGLLTDGGRGMDMSEMGLRLTPCELDSGTAKFDLVLYAFEVDDTVRFLLEYSTDLFKLETVERMSGYFMNVLRAAVEEPDTNISEIMVLSEEERNLYINGMKEQLGLGGSEDVESRGGPEKREADFDF